MRKALFPMMCLLFMAFLAPITGCGTAGVPDLVGLPLEDAEAMAARSGLGIIEEYGEAPEEDLVVVEQTPEPDRAAAGDATVTVVLGEASRVDPDRLEEIKEMQRRQSACRDVMVNIGSRQPPGSMTELPQSIDYPADLGPLPADSTLEVIFFQMDGGMTTATGIVGYVDSSGNPVKIISVCEVTLVGDDWVKSKEFILE